MAKTRNGTLMKVLIAALTAFLLAAIVWIWNAAGIVKDVEANIDDIESMGPRINSHDRSIIGIEKDLSHLAQRVEENSVTQRQILILQKDILDEVRKK